MLVDVVAWRPLSLFAILFIVILVLIFVVLVSGAGGGDVFPDAARTVTVVLTAKGTAADRPGG